MGKELPIGQGREVRFPHHIARSHLQVSHGDLILRLLGGAPPAHGRRRRRVTSSASVRNSLLAARRSVPLGLERGEERGAERVMALGLLRGRSTRYV